MGTKLNQQWYFVSIHIGMVTGNLSKTYFGCFENNWMYPVMDGWNISFPKEMTSQKCVSSCFTRGYPFVALVSS